MTSELRVRPIVDKDYDSVIAMLEQGRRDSLFSPGDPITRESFQNYIKNNCYENYQMAVAELDKGTIGFTDFYTFGGVGHLLGIYVLNSERRLGVGSSLLGYSVQKLTDLGCHKINTIVYSYNEPVLSFLINSGFAKVAILSDDEFHRDVIYFSKGVH